MKLGLLVLFFSQFVVAQSRGTIKDTNFEYCLSEGKKIVKNSKNELFNFMDSCILEAGANLTEGQDPKVCLVAAKLGINNSEIKQLEKKCRDEVGYQLCRAEAKDFSSRLNCATSARSPIPYADCKKEVMALTQLRDKEKSIKLTAQQLEVFKKGFCEKSPRPVPPSPDEGSFK